MRRSAIRLLPVLTFAGLLILWQIVSVLGIVNPVLLPPLDVIYSRLENPAIRDQIPGAFMVTLYEMLMGFAIGAGGGLVLGSLTVMSRWFSDSIFPFVVLLQNIPRIALAPLFLIWFGYTLDSKIALAATTCFFPVVINTTVGLKAATPDQIGVMRSLGASPFQQLRMVEIPAAMPYIMAGLKYASALALTGAVVGEFVSSSAGLGFQIRAASASLDVATIYVMIVVLGLLGCACFVILDIVERWIVKGRPPRSNLEGGSAAKGAARTANPLARGSL